MPTSNAQVATITNLNLSSDFAILEETSKRILMETLARKKYGESPKKRLSLALPNTEVN